MNEPRLHLLARVYIRLAERGATWRLCTPYQASLVSAYLRANGCKESARAAAPFPLRFVPRVPPHSDN